MAEFYSMYGQWLAVEPGSAGLEDAADQAAWARSDEDLAAAVWGKLSDRAKQLFSTLIDNPGRKFSGDELAEMLAIPNGKHGVAGVLAWPGRHSVKAGRRLPWSWEYPEEYGPAVYWFEPEIAELFGAARGR